MSTGSSSVVGVAGVAGGGGGGVGAVDGGSGAGAVGGGGGGSGGPCGACKFLRRKCVSGCIFAPYFDSEQGAAHFSAVHKVFGASNVSKLLLHIPVPKRLDAVITICYEANARLREPVYGCMAHIFALQQQVANLQAELSFMRAHLATLEPPPPPPPPQPRPPPLPLPVSISDIPSSSVPASFDLATLFETSVRPPWSLQRQEERQMELRLTESTTSGTEDLRALARELVDGRGSASVDPPAISK